MVPIHGAIASTRRRPRRWLFRLANLLILIGVLALAEVVVTMVWQEPFTALYTTIRQQQLGGSLQRLSKRQPDRRTQALLALTRSTNQRIALLARELEMRARPGSAVGRIDLPSIGARFTLVDGTGEAELALGPGVYRASEYPGSRLPGAGKLTAIAGHRTTFLAPFRQINRLKLGDRIFLTMPYGRFEYTVLKLRTVFPEDVSAVLKPPPGVNLVLSSCYPAFSAAERILAYASLRSVVPRGAALAYQVQLSARQAPHSELAARLGLPSALPALPPWR